MAETPQPIRKLGPREFLGGLGLMAMGFGAYSWLKGQDIPWGAQQIYGTVLFVGGVLVACGAYFWPRKKA